MSEMKNTYSEWLKCIPAHWNLSKISALYTLRNQKVSDKDYLPLSVTMKGILPQLETAAKTNAHDDRKLVKKGDFAINSRSDRRGSCGISDYDGSVSLINTVMKPTGEMNPGYYNWLFHTTEFADEFYKWGHGIVDDLWTTNWQDMKHIDVPVPPLSEQHRIADFLDSKCSQIDQISKKIQEEIDTLEEYKKSVITEAVTKGLDPNVEMKDSGIEWIGMIPVDWKLPAIKNIADLVTCGVASTPNYVDENEGILFLSAQNIQDNKIDLSIRRYITKELHNSLTKFIKPRKGDILQVRVGASIGKTAIVDIEEEFSIYVSLSLIRTNKRIANKYLCYYLSTNIFRQYAELYIDFAGTQGNLNVKVLKNMKTTLPGLEEQYEIVRYLDNKCSDINEVILSKQQQLSTLEEYKKSLIYEYVTGKKEVAYV